MQKAKTSIRKEERVRWFELRLNASTPVPETCSTNCQCKQYFPCRLPKHNPCAFKIPFEANHTHILIEEYHNGTINKVCVSPKCLGSLIETQLGNPAPVPTIICYPCYHQRQLKRDARFILGTDGDSSSLVWAWRKIGSM
ncbi:MAG: hypothetical protein ACYCPW_10185 [Nitrososphaerales archaeon]